jgi:predicted phosphodiesterase
MSLDIDAALRATEPAPVLDKDEPRFNFEFDGNRGYIQTGVVGDRPKTWDEFIIDAGLDPEEVEVIEPVNVRGWDGLKRLEDGTTSVVRLKYYRLSVRRRTLKVDIDDLIKSARRTTKIVTAPVATDVAFVIALGDLQLGKVDGDGVEGTVERFMSSTKSAIDRYKRLNRGKTEKMPIYLIHLGDCIEGMVSQGGANTWRTSLTTTEQVRLYRKILQAQVKDLSAITPELVMCGVPGNHDEAHRPLHTYGDSWAIDAVSAVADAFELAGGYDNVRFYAPERDELTLTLDICGTTVGMAHGHQFGNGVEGWKKWWQGQSHGRQPVGSADILLAGHKHHLNVNQGARTFIQVPALESESTWWKHKAGEVSAPGIVTMLVGGGGWSGLEVLL